MIDAQTLLADLTEPQRQAVTHLEGPLMILAGAGSGKTRVITRRVAYLIAQGIPPSSILAITFTNKAAGEMKQRVAAVLDKPLRDWGRLDQPSPMICTFHSLCLRILRHYAAAIGLPANFSVYDSHDQSKVIKEALKSLDLSATNFPPSAIHSAISKAKNQLQTADDFSRQVGGDYFLRVAARVYIKYQAILKSNSAMDFDDLLLNAALSFRSHPEILRELQDRFQYVLIDEYQDTNHAQYILAHALAQRHQNVCVVGDPDQSIYAWRGADIRNLLDFEKDYPNATVVKLEQNYRSTKTVLQLASQLISRNIQRKDKTLWTENPQGEKAELFMCEDEHDEAHRIASRLKELNQRGFAWNSMAILYRINSLSRVMEDALRRAGIPYQIARGVEFYNRKEIKDVLAYLR
ncbi:MAG TPA: UvrD-helicase domain-containing protein, partial [Tepidisphaeraceae bacterium]|nr:UvrD-helicase domain-containing protein [Tepidisphaeraceae bacterium]